MKMSRCLNHLMLQVIIRPSSVRAPVRLYSRWSHRSPAKVLLPFEAKGDLKKERIISLDPAILNKSKQKDEVTNSQESTAVFAPSSVPPTDLKKSVFPPEKTKQIKQQKEEKLKKQKFYLSQLKVFDDNGEILYEKLKENDARISSLMVKLKSKKERSQSNQVLVEGWRLIVDGLEAKCALKYVIFSRSADLYKIKPFLPKTGIKFFRISYKELQLWSDVETSPGIIGIFQTPTAENVQLKSKPLPLQLICDNIRVPGNLGAILRVAVGAGCEKVLLTKGCVDVWDPKVIRSAAGAHFRLPIYDSIEWSDISSHLHPNTAMFIADSNTNTEVVSEENDRLEQNDMPVVPYYGVDFSSFQHTTIILGGETEGISEESYSLAASKNGIRLNIPLQKGVDSLNTGMALAVIAFEVKKQLTQAWSKQKLENQILQAT